MSAEFLECLQHGVPLTPKRFPSLYCRVGGHTIRMLPSHESSPPPCKENRNVKLQRFLNFKALLDVWELFSTLPCSGLTAL